MEEEQLHPVAAEPAEAALERDGHVARGVAARGAPAARQPAETGFVAACSGPPRGHDRERRLQQSHLRAQHHLAGVGPQRPPQQPLADAPGVAVGGVEEVDSRVPGGVDRPAPLRRGAALPERPELRAAHPERGDHQPRAAEGLALQPALRHPTARSRTRSTRPGRPGCPARPRSEALEPGSAASAWCRTVARSWAQRSAITSGEKNCRTYSRPAAPILAASSGSRASCSRRSRNSSPVSATRQWTPSSTLSPRTPADGRHDGQPGGHGLEHLGLHAGALDHRRHERAVARELGGHVVHVARGTGSRATRAWRCTPSGQRGRPRTAGTAAGQPMRLATSDANQRTATSFGK